MDLNAAIQNKHLVSFNYDGHPRTVIPAAYGMQATTKNLVLRGYQIRGTSKSRAVPLWDLFLVNKMSGVTILDETFATLPPGYKKGDKHISPIFSEL